MSINIGIITEGASLEQESFVNAHRELLNGNIHFFYGGAFNLTYQDSNRIISLFSKMALRFFGSVFKKSYFDIEFSFKRILRRKKIDVVLFEFGTTAVQLYPYLNDLKIPYIVNFYGYDINMTSVINRNSERYKSIFKTAYKITTVSLEMKSKLKELGCKKEKILVNQAGPHIDFQSLRPVYKNNSFFALGRFVDKKSPIETILAFNKVLIKHPDAQLHFGGDGPLLEASIRLVNGLGADNNVHFNGRLSKKEYLPIMEDSLALIQHSVTTNSGDMEGTPVVILEAGLAGLPVISTNHAGIPEVVIHNKTGLLVEEHDIDGMSEHMIFLIENKSVAKTLGTAARDYITQNFSMEKHLNILDQLIADAKNHSQ